MSNKNIAGDDELLRNVVEDVLDNESSRIISDSSFISEPFGFYEQNDVESDEIPTSDEDIHKSSSSKIDDSDEDKDYEPSQSSDSEFLSDRIVSSTPQKLKIRKSAKSLPLKKRNVTPSDKIGLGLTDQGSSSSVLETNDSYTLDNNVNNAPSEDNRPPVFINNPPNNAPSEDNRPPVFINNPPNVGLNNYSDQGSDTEDVWVEVGPDDDFPLGPVRFQELPGPKHMPPSDSPPISYFNLFFTQILLLSFVRETNRYATQLLHSTEYKDNSRVKKMAPCDTSRNESFYCMHYQYGHCKEADNIFLLVHFAAYINTLVQTDVST
ncbi:hypothetical protein J6590_086192 [Homalodisca vitripennis]|nr:hypothetical protein J6590_086192 [Homalodisca vitripennis]